MMWVSGNDGKRYKMPVLPGGGIPHAMGHPIQQPHETSPVAYYERAGDTTVGGYFVYFYRGMREPGGRRVLAQTPVIDTAPVIESTGTEQRTCEGYGTGPCATSHATEGGE